MNREFIVDFLDVYREHPSLWKVKSKDYVNRNLKKLAYDALVEVCAKYNIKANRALVTKKVQSLRSAFRKEYKKVDESITSAKKQDDIYISKLWYYDLLLFTKDQDEVSAGISNMRNSTIKEEQVEADEDNTEETLSVLSSNHEDIDETSSSASRANTSSSLVASDEQQPKTKRKESEPPFFKAYRDAAASYQETHDVDAFGIYVGKRLKCIQSETQKMFAECLITSVLQKAMCQRLTEHTTLAEHRMPNIVYSTYPTAHEHSPSASMASYSNFSADH